MKYKDSFYIVSKRANKKYWLYSQFTNYEE